MSQLGMVGPQDPVVGGPADDGFGSIAAVPPDDSNPYELSPDSARPRRPIWTLDGTYVVTDIGPLVRQVRAMRHPTVARGVDWSVAAQTFTLPAGPYPGKGYLLLSRAQLDQIGQSWPGGLDGDHTLDLVCGADTISFVKLRVCASPVCVTPGAVGDPAATYLVELADPRWLAQNPYFACPVDKSYNVPAPDGGWVADNGAQAPSLGYYAGTINGTAPWTWQGMLDDLWTQIAACVPSLGGSSPPLPTVPADTLPEDSPGLDGVEPFDPDDPLDLDQTSWPDGVPVGWRFQGVSVWEAYNQVLERLQVVFCWLPDGTTRLARKGYSDPAFDAAAATFDAYPWHPADEDPLSAASSRVPSQVIVYSPSLFSQYGQEHTLEATADQWSTASYDLSLSVVAPDAALSGVTPAAGTAHSLWDDLPAVVPADGAISQDPAHQARALERANDYYRAVLAGRKKLVYSGLLGDPGFWPGSQVSAVRWSLGGAGPQGLAGPTDGAATEVLYQPYLLWCDPQGGGACAAPPWPDRLRPPDLGRTTFPNYPPRDYRVQVTGHASPGLGTPGTFWDGVLVRYDVLSDSYRPTTTAVWARALNGRSLPTSTNLPAFLSGQAYGRPLLDVADDVVPGDVTADCPPYTLVETDVRCEAQSAGPRALNIYNRVVTVSTVSGCPRRSPGAWFFVRQAGCCECGGGTPPGNCCSCRVYLVTIAGVAAGCDANDNYALTYSGSACAWSGRGAVFHGLATLAFSGAAGSIARLEITTGSCLAVYTGTAASCSDFTLTLSTSAGTGWPPTVHVTCQGPSSGPTGTVPCVPGVCQWCNDPPMLWKVDASGASGGPVFTGDCTVFNSIWTLTYNSPCLWRSFSQVGGLFVGVTLTVSQRNTTINFDALDGLGVIVASASYESRLPPSGNCCQTLTMKPPLVGDPCDCGTAQSGSGNSSLGCPCATVPSAWVVDGNSGDNTFTGAFAEFAALWRMPLYAVCQWLVNADGLAVPTAGLAWASVDIASDGTLSLGFVSSQGAQVVYAGTLSSDNCCQEYLLLQTEVVFVPGDLNFGSFPSQLRVTPDCTGGGGGGGGGGGPQVGTCPPTVTAAPVCCTGTGTGTGTGAVPCVPGRCVICANPPAFWSVPASIFTGSSLENTPFNDAWVLWPNGDCEWSAQVSTPDGATYAVTLTLFLFGGVTLTFARQGGAGAQLETVVFNNPVAPADCCVATVDLDYQSDNVGLSPGFTSGLVVAVAPTCCPATGTTGTGGTGGTGPLGDRCLFSITVTLGWPEGPPYADYDLYVRNLTDGGTCYYNDTTGGGMVLNQDAYPNCNHTPPPPEIITGGFTGDHQFRVYTNQWTDCQSANVLPTVQSFVVFNGGNVAIVVGANGVSFALAPGQSVNVLSSFHYVGYATGNQGRYQGGDLVAITCAASTGTGTGTGSGPPLVNTVCCSAVSQNLALVLFGSLASFGVVALTWNGSNWTGGATSASCGTCVFTLRCVSGGPPNNWGLTVSGATFGSGTTVNPGDSVSCSPFLLAGSGTAAGGMCTGNFLWQVA